MDIGFLYLESSRSHPGMVRVLTTLGDAPNPASPEGDDADPAIRYIARFNDIDAARLHTFSALRRGLVDIDNSLFRVDLIDAIAAADSVALPHRRIYLDPDLGVEAIATIEDKMARRRRHRLVVDQIWRLVGWLGLAWLVLLGFVTF